ncbi:hypothetical protein BT63DRAFT_454986 [Microthyrium microscopicum]|uniref:Roadblock/LAMTOR2 domain-containing protein n=1 Tax=Microthyrium microscopicum TaxID=703497 RepID=A0A6A6UAN0_9PEZI|nr:hypothetical protein BT63DRAFT_454986 [Microthyrium microscopicum]
MYIATVTQFIYKLITLMEPSDESLGLLARMSAKPGVQSTLVLSRTDGAILRADGLLALRRKRASSTAADAATISTSPVRTFTSPAKSTATNGSDSLRNSGAFATEDGEAEGQQTGEDVAKAVWKYVKATEGLVEDLDVEDEVRLLRVRTKKSELVVVPHSKFLLVVVHDTPPA